MSTTTFALPFSADEVFEKLTDPDFLTDRSLAIGELSASCEVEDYGDKVVIKMERVVNRELPSVLASMFNSKQTMRLEEEWNTTGETRTGKYTISVEGQPVTISATFSLTPTDEGCEYSIKHSAKAKILLVGKKVEEYILSQTDDGLQKEMDYLAEALS